MARTEIIAVETGRKYHWPEQQLNLWMLIMIIGAGCELGFFVFFYVTQVQMDYGIPWYIIFSGVAEDRLTSLLGCCRFRSPLHPSPSFS
jgi:hypothetical protein